MQGQVRTFTLFLKNCKAKGSRNEKRSIRLLEAAGYACTRAAASLGVWDIIGVGSTDFALVQVKTRDWPGFPNAVLFVGSERHRLKRPARSSVLHLYL